MGLVALHLFVESVREYQMVRKLETMGFHWVIGSVVVVPNLGVVEVRDPLLGAHTVFALESMTISANCSEVGYQVPGAGTRYLVSYERLR
jgi:hypothetical protein